LFKDFFVQNKTDSLQYLLTIFNHDFIKECLNFIFAVHENYKDIPELREKILVLIKRLPFPINDQFFPPEIRTIIQTDLQQEQSTKPSRSADVEVEQRLLPGLFNQRVPAHSADFAGSADAVSDSKAGSANPTQSDPHARGNPSV
jgi:hypothetical protein